MNDKPKGRLLSKQRLHIEHFDLDVPYSQGTKFLDRVNAVNLSLEADDPLAGKALRMSVFNQAVKTFLRGKENAVVDIEERDRPESDYGPDRTIVQAYDEEGKPVSTKQGGGGGNWRRSLEDDLALEGFKRVSIEGQTAVAQVGERLADLLKVPTAEWPRYGLDEATWKRILGKYWQAVEKGLDNYLAPTAAVTQGTARKPDQRPQEAKSAARKPDQVSKDQPPHSDPVKHVGDLLTRANKIGVNPAGVAEACQVERPDQLKDLDDAWKKVQAFAKKTQAVAP